MKHILDGTTFRDLLNIRDLISDPDRGEQCRDAEGSDEGGARDLQAAHPQPQESDIDFSNTWVSPKNQILRDNMNLTIVFCKRLIYEFLKLGFEARHKAAGLVQAVALDCFYV